MTFAGAFQSTFLGHSIRLISGRRLLEYPEEVEAPRRYTKEGIAEREKQRSGSNNEKRRRGSEDRDSERPPSDGLRPDASGVNANGTLLAPAVDGGRIVTRSGSEDTFVNGDRGDEGSNQSQPARNDERGKQERTEANKDEEEGTDPHLVHWYGPSDPENPYNWSTSYKCFVAFQMALLTFAVYIGSSIYSAGIMGPNPDSITQHFDVSVTTGLVGLTVFVAGYGVGPMIWSPLSEFPSIGRMPVYIGTLFIFVGLQFPTIYANNIHTLLAMRFLAGFFGSPCLAIGGATMGDMFAPKHLAYAVGVWGCGAICGPVLGPLLGGFTYSGKGWTWPLWVLTWLSGACLVLLVMFFPETSAKNAELDAADKSAGTVAKEILWRPFELLMEPILIVFNLYLALIYGLLYIWFESFPLVFTGVHGFNPGESGLAFLGIFIGAWVSCALFCIYIHKYLAPIFDANEGTIPDPEIRLYPAIIAAVCIPVAMFGFGLLGAYERIHWMAPICFTGFFGVGAFILFQCVFAYFGDVYYTELASVLTLNDLFRSSYGAAFPLFANALFHKLGIQGGNCLLGGLACLFVPAPFLFIKYGKHIRARSKYAAKTGIPQELLRKYGNGGA